MEAARRGLDRLLSEFPDDRLITAAEVKNFPEGPSVWTLVELENTVGPHVYAIFNATGAVHEFDAANPGAVHEDPLFTVEDDEDLPSAVVLTTHEKRALARCAGLVSGLFTETAHHGELPHLQSAQMKLEMALAIEQADR